jgi:hypothetical protein
MCICHLSTPLPSPYGCLQLEEELLLLRQRFSATERLHESSSW